MDRIGKTYSGSSKRACVMRRIASGASVGMVPAVTRTVGASCSMLTSISTEMGALPSRPTGRTSSSPPSPRDRAASIRRLRKVEIPVDVEDLELLGERRDEEGVEVLCGHVFEAKDAEGVEAWGLGELGEVDFGAAK